MAAKSLEVNTLNIFLIIVSLILAYQFPFELFILAYAILGPLHYVTEINWLGKKNFFVKERKQVSLLVLITLLIAIPFTLVSFTQNSGAEANEGLWHTLREYAASFMFAGFITALVLVFTRKWAYVLTALIGSFLVGLLFEGNLGYGIIMGGMVPTIIHVFAFTFFFMLYGAMKDKSTTGIIGAVLMLVVPFIIIYVPIDVEGMKVGQYFTLAYDSSKFMNINYSLGWTIGLFEKQPNYTLLSEIGVKIQIFIAFAYTYHYLNWFSKTTVIGWHKVINKKRLFLILGIWAVTVTVYLVNYLAGFILMLFLSYLHVLMEFPLNWVSIKEVFAFPFKKANT